MKSIVNILDSWIGRKIVYPVVVKLCHWFDWNQYHIYRYAYVLMSMFAFIDSWHRGNWFVICFVGVWLFIFTLAAGVLGGDPPPPADRIFTPIERVLYASLATTIAILDGISGGLSYFDIVLPLGAFAEYTRTIDTIPPRKIKRKKAAIAA